MSLKRLEDVRPGDIVGSDVLNPQGATLVKSGVVLQEKHLRLFKMWGIDKLNIRDGSSEDRGEEYDVLLDKAEAEIKARFGASLDNEIMAEILRIAVEQRAAWMSSGTE